MSDLEMSMFHMLTNSFTLYSEAYECPQNLTVVKFERPVLGSFFLFFGVLFIALYIPCFLAIIPKMRGAPVYQVMFALAIFDILSLSVNSVCTGIFDILGISFCHYPIAIFCLGVIASGSWMAGCVTCIMLALDRCVEINPQFPLGFLYQKRFFPNVRILMILWTIYSFLFVKGLTFSAEYSCWFFDPLIGKDTVFQAISLCFFHTAAAVTYEYLQFIQVTPTLIIASQFIWQWSSGAVCLTYLFFNRTIRNSVLKMLIPKRIREKLGLYIGFDEHHAVEEAAGNAPTGNNAVGAMIKADNFVAPC